MVFILNIIFEVKKNHIQEIHSIIRKFSSFEVFVLALAVIQFQYSKETIA